MLLYTWNREEVFTVSVDGIRAYNTGKYVMKNNSTLNSSEYQKEEEFELPMESNDDAEENKGNDLLSVQTQSKEMNFWSLINADNSLKNQIPVVHSIVTAKNPADDKIYVTFFSDKKIICTNGDGSIAWNLDVDEDGEKKVVELLGNYKPDNALIKEIYSDENLGIVSSKDFWQKLFKKEK